MKIKRFLALGGVILIAAFYVIAIGAAFSHSPSASSWLMAAIFSTVVIPVMIYAALVVYKLVKRPEERDESSK